jgi:diacylglycerol kinase (ATP)
LVELARTASWSEGSDVARRAAESGRRVIAVGGDGTVQSAVSGLVLSGYPAPELAIVPAGRGNDLARALGLPRRFEAALQLALDAPAARVLDAGLLTCDGIERVFANNLGIGFDGGVAARASHIPIRGVSGYLLATLASLAIDPGPWSLSVERDGVELAARRFTLFSVGNGPTTGGGFRLTPQADPSDGRLDYCSAEAASRWQVLRLLPRVLTGSHLRDARVESGPFSTLSICAERGVPVHADGELVARSAREIHVRLLAGRLRVVAPVREG